MDKLLMEICPICGRLFSKNSLQRHMNTAHTRKALKICSICAKEFTNASNFAYHMAHHANERSFTCTHCPRTFNTSADLRQHQRKSHGLDVGPCKRPKKTPNCEQCCNGFLTEQNYELHMTSAHQKAETEMEKCNICGKLIRSLAQHLKNVHEAHRFFCEYPECGKTFSKRTGLDRHTATHTKAVNFRCPECSKGFIEKSQLERHFVTHLKPKVKEEVTQFQCSVCLKYLKRNSDLVRHISSVHGTKDYECDMCGPKRRFSDKFAVLKHIKYYHMNIKRQKTERKIVRLADIIAKVFADSAKFSDSQLEMHEDYLDESFHDDDMTPKLNIQKMTQMVSFENVLIKQKKFDNMRKEIENNDEIKSKYEDNENLIDYDLIKEEYYLEEALIDGPNDNESNVDESVECIEELLLLQEDEEEIQPVIMTKIAAKEVDKPIVWECKRDCKKTFESFEQLKLHNKRNHDWKCKKCPRDSKKFVNLFFRREDFERHWIENHSDEPFPDKIACTLCGDLFADKPSLQYHQQSDHGMKKTSKPSKAKPRKKYVYVNRYSCTYCNESIKSCLKLKKHIFQVHNNGAVPLRKCFLCQEEYEKFEDFESHVIEHGGEYVCFVCNGRPFHDSSSLKTHQLETHYRCDEIKPYHCDICDRRFQCHSQMQKHMREVHIQDTDPHVCAFCGKMFRVEQNLIVHRRNTHGEKKFICQTCGHGFVTKSRYEAHMAGKHTKEMNYYCEICNSYFTNVLNYNHHKNSIHGEYNKCKDCDLTFATYPLKKKHLLEVHPELRQLRCHICFRSFRFEHNLRVHMDAKHPESATTEGFPEHFVPPQFHDRFQQEFNLHNFS